ncbi:hypothetical protein [Paraburkholderia pallida]|nr:hypothetical protein [Paraburkholderia pallida]
MWNIRKSASVAVFAAIGVAGCAGVTDVVSTGSDTFMVASHSTMGWSSGPAQKASAFEKADAYCKRSGKEMKVLQATDSGNGGFGKISSGEVDFKCGSLASEK